MSISTEPHLGTDIWTNGGPWRFTREAAIGVAAAQTLYSLYQQALEPHGEPIGLITLTRHHEAMPWVSPEYFEARFPEQWARKAVYYLGYLLARPVTRRTRFLETICKVCVEPLVAERAVIAYDVCSYNNDMQGFADRISRVARQFADSHVHKLDAQVYYAVNLT